VARRRGAPPRPARPRAGRGPRRARPRPVGGPRRAGRRDDGRGPLGAQSAALGLARAGCGFSVGEATRAARSAVPERRDRRCDDPVVDLEDGGAAVHDDARDEAVAQLVAQPDQVLRLGAPDRCRRLDLDPDDAVTAPASHREAAPRRAPLVLPPSYGRATLPWRRQAIVPTTPRTTGGEITMKKALALIGASALLCAAVATAALAAGGKGRGVPFAFRGELKSVSSASLTLTVEGGSHNALRLMLGQSQEDRKS